MFITVRCTPNGSKWSVVVLMKFDKANCVHNSLVHTQQVKLVVLLSMMAEGGNCVRNSLVRTGQVKLVCINIDNG